MRRKISILLMPLLLLAMVEGLFRLGIWEPLATPLSHAGTSVRLKYELLAPEVARIDFVTLGSSRPEYGIDHQRVKEEARKHDFIHANLSMPGVHWMSIGVLTDWLRVHHPEIRGGLIALSSEDFAWPGNGAYELGIVQPFRKSSDEAWIAAHVPFEANNIASFGSRIALFSWRDDVRDFLIHPFSRLNRLRKSAGKSDTSRLFANPDLPGDMCSWGLASLSACTKLATALGSPAGLRGQCKQISATLKERPDYATLAAEFPLPEFMQRTRDLVRSQLRAIDWTIPPIVVLMPTPPIWRSDDHAKGLQHWARQILEPLDEEGSIRLIDATTIFDDSPGNGCHLFSDFYHQNAKGRTQFSDWLIPQLETMLYTHPIRQHP